MVCVVVFNGFVVRAVIIGIPFAFAGLVNNGNRPSCQKGCDRSKEAKDEHLVGQNITVLICDPFPYGFIMLEDRMIVTTNTQPA